jgi:hypothetical protein
LSPYTACELVRLVFQPYQPQANDKVKNTQDSDDDDMSSSDESREGAKPGDGKKRKDDQDSEEEEDIETKMRKAKKDVDDVVTPEVSQENRQTNGWIVDLDNKLLESMNVYLIVAYLKLVETVCLSKALENS